MSNWEFLSHLALLHLINMASTFQTAVCRILSCRNYWRLSYSFFSKVTSLLWNSLWQVDNPGLISRRLTTSESILRSLLLLILLYTCDGKKISHKAYLGIYWNGICNDLDWPRVLHPLPRAFINIWINVWKEAIRKVFIFPFYFFMSKNARKTIFNSSS